MKTLISFLALSLCAVAQTLIGLPQYGVELTGSIENPVIVNNSGKAICEVTVMLYDAAGKPNGTNTESYCFDSLDGVVHPGDSAEVHGAVAKSGDPIEVHIDNPKNKPVPITVKAVLDSIIFADGSFVGPDNAKWFTDAAISYAISSATASLSWPVLESLVKVQPRNWEESVKYRVAANLIGTRDSESFDAARKVAEGLMALPKLRRVQ